MATTPALATDIPHAATAWQRTLTREAHAVWGLDAPVALFGAQIHQESHWDAQARSVYAEGLAQFTAGTARDMARWHPELEPVDVYDPRWAIRAMVRYDHRLYARIGDTADECERWAMTLSAYNGGLGWLQRDRALCDGATGCDPARWWGHVDQHTRRANWAREESRAYATRILHILHPRYARAGWSGPLICHG